jgi:SulP family sulfate permease
MLGSLLSAAIVISLVGFMEAISIAKAIAARTRQKIDPNQELVGQGLANIVGSLTHAFPVSGSFSRSAVNINAGALTGMASVFTGMFVLLTLLFLTPLLYHLPQAVLAAVIIMAVIGLINFEAIRHAWHANRHDGIAAVVTFVATLAFAPNIQNGILTGIMLSLALLLYRMMRPRIALLGMHGDATLRDSQRHNLPGLHPQLGAVRFDGALRFVNVAYFEDALLRLERENPELSHILIKASGINDIDASGVEMLKNLLARFKANGITLALSGAKKQVAEVMERTGLTPFIGADNIFATDREAVDALLRRLPPAPNAPTPTLPHAA